MADAPVDLTLTVESYTDSLFTLPHDLVSHEAVIDGRGTFSHLGVKMEGLESKRHLNFKAAESEGQVIFSRDPTVTNVLKIVVGIPGDASVPNRVVVESYQLNTQFYTRNNVKTIYKLVLIDALTKTETIIAQNLPLEGNSIYNANITPTVATHAVAWFAEGGLTRFKLFGKPADKQNIGPATLLKNAKIFGCTDSHYGDPSLVLREQRLGRIMAGWETSRHVYRQRLVLALEKPSNIQKIEIDTYMHNLNSFKYSIILGSVQKENSSEDQIIASLPKWNVYGPEDKIELVDDNDINERLQEVEVGKGQVAKYSLAKSDVWFPVLNFVALDRDALHTYDEAQLAKAQGVTHLAVFGIPDGGIHRLGVYGTVA